MNNELNDHAFTDPVLRCDSCQALVKRTTLHKIGSCPKCGNKRVRNLTVFNDEERTQMLDWGFDAFVDEYEVVSE
jgi:Zn finger protein HypA/HybF involved in hydrogenase expression